MGRVQERDIGHALAVTLGLYSPITEFCRVDGGVDLEHGRTKRKGVVERVMKGKQECLLLLNSGRK